MGPTGKGTSIGIKSNITITSLSKQPAYYFLRISPKISPRISTNIFITSLSYPHPSVHHQSSRASFKILPRIFMSINITSITPVSKITYQEYPAKSSCLKSRLQTSPFFLPPLRNVGLIIFFYQFVNGNCESRASPECIECCCCGGCYRCHYW